MQKLRPVGRAERAKNPPRQPEAFMINGVILKKLQTMEQTLVELRSIQDTTSTHLDQDWRTRRALERFR
jgi:hypothetical protein